LHKSEKLTISNFGFWILDFGFWIEGFRTFARSLIKKRMAEMNSQNPDIEGDYQSKIQNGIKLRRI
jgi:hypothetical protein